MQEKIILNEIIITPLVKARLAFNEAVDLDETSITRDATIQRFEFTFELSWKTLKRVLKHKGIDISNPRDVFRASAKEKLIADPKQWFEYLDCHNITSHAYDEKKAELIYAKMPGFKKLLDQLLEQLMAL